MLCCCARDSLTAAEILPLDSANSVKLILENLNSGGGGGFRGTNFQLLMLSPNLL